MTELSEKLTTIDELSKAYQRIASCNKDHQTRQEVELLDKLSELVKSISVLGYW